MLAVEEKKEIEEMAEAMRKLDATGRMLIMSNATVLLARQELVNETREREGEKK